MSTPVAYLRKSRVTLASPGEMSHDAQIAAVHELAAKHGDAEPLVLSDWSRSGRHGARRRPGYAEMIRMIEAGEASAVYSYSLSRLSRSLRDFAELVDIAQRHNVPVRLAKDTLNLTTASGRLNVNVLASVAAFEAEIAQERAQDTITARRARGDDVGSAPYGSVLQGGKLHPDPERPIAPVLDAYRQAGTYSGTARILNAMVKASGEPKPPRSDRWSAPAVRRIVNRAMPETASTDGRPGRKARHDFRLAGLLVCHCGTTLTGVRMPRRTKYGTYEYVTYKCWRGRYDAAHGRPFMVNEGQVLPWVQAEVARLRLPETIETTDDAPQREQLEAKRARVVEAFIDGLIDKAERDRRLLAIGDELDGMQAVAAVLDVPDVDWTWEPALLNRVIRSLLSRVNLGTDLRPVDAVWKLPAEYVA
jgi:DNA invertase Pin-like site-specific DNA recombinase